MRLLRCFAGVLIALMLTSCKVVMVVPKGGEISWTGYYCPSESTCQVDVIDFYFDETFTARPSAGYKFKQWKKGYRRFCGGKNQPCRLAITPFTGEWIAVIQPFLESADEVFYLQPVFEKAISDTSKADFLYSVSTTSSGSGIIIGRFNPNNGDLISESSIFADNRGVFVDIEFVNGILYGLQNRLPTLHKINLQTESATSFPSNRLADQFVSLASYNGRLFAFTANYTEIWEINLNTGALVKLSATNWGAPGRGIIHSVTFSPDGKLIAYGTFSSSYSDYSSLSIMEIDIATGKVSAGPKIQYSPPPIGGPVMKDMAFTKYGLVAINQGGEMVSIDATSGIARKFNTLTRPSAAISYSGLTSN